MPEAYASSIDRLRELVGTARDPRGHAFAMIAEYLRRDGKLDEARGVLEEGLQAHPDFASAHVVAAQVLTELGDLEQAKVALARVLELDAGNGRAAGLKQGLVFAEEEAAVAWARAQGDGPAVHVDDEVATVTLGELYLEQGAPEKAADVARQILEADPAHAAALALLAKVEGGVVEAVAPVEEAPVDQAVSPLETADAIDEAPPVDEAALVEGAPAIEEVPPVEATLPATAVPPAEEPVATTEVADLAQIAVPVEDLGPDAVPIASLAPDAVPVESLAPDLEEAASPQSTPDTSEAVPIAQLAPDSPAPAPGGAAPATPTEPAGDKPANPDGKEDLDDFMDWLDEH